MCRRYHQEIQGVDGVVVCILQHGITVEAQHFIVILLNDLLKVWTNYLVIIANRKRSVIQWATAPLLITPKWFQQFWPSTSITVVGKLWRLRERLQHFADGIVALKFVVIEVVAVVAARFFLLLFQYLEWRGLGRKEALLLVQILLELFADVV